MQHKASTSLRPRAERFPSADLGRPGLARILTTAAALCAVAALAGCDDDADGAARTGDDAAVSGDARAPDAAADGGPADAAGDATLDAGPPLELTAEEEACEYLAPGHCLYPWPSDRWLVADEASVTGLRLAYDREAMPRNNLGSTVDPAPYNRLDGYSPSSQILAVFSTVPDLGDRGGPADPDRSLADDFPTVVLDLETGERIAHWIELDARARPAGGVEEVALFIRPATRLLPDRRYGVAIRGLRDTAGAPLAVAPAFAALRDGRPSTSAGLEARRPSYEALFGALGNAGVNRPDLQLAWWFHTESEDSTRRELLAMRADALSRLGAEGLGCTVTSVEDDFQGGARRVRGTITTPWYLDGDAQPSPVVRGPDGLPAHQRDAEVPFTAIVPESLHGSNGAGPLILWGHGLFGEADGTVSDANTVAAAESFQQVMAGTDWIGMSTSDLAFLATALADISRFYLVGERLMQAMINFIALERSLPGVCAQDPAFANALGLPAIAPAPKFFIGGSQGSVLGGTYLTLSPDVERGALVVGGSDFSFMIERSIHFNTFELLLNPAYPRRLDTALIMALSQHVWDRAESGSYLRDTLAGLPGIGPKQMVYLVAENDAQVPNLASHRAARLAGLPVLEGSAHVPWGTETVPSPHTGSVYISLDWGDRPTPEGNESPQEDDGGHVGVGFSEVGTPLIGVFFQTGVAVVDCVGPCRVGPAAE